MLVVNSLWRNFMEDGPSRENTRDTNLLKKNNNASRPASILQVCELLGIAPTRKMQLVAANNSGHIPAMINMGAAKSEIAIFQNLKHKIR